MSFYYDHVNRVYMYVVSVGNPDGNVQLGETPANASQSNLIRAQNSSNDAINIVIADAAFSNAQEQDQAVAQELQDQFDNMNNMIGQQPNLENWTTLNMQENIAYGAEPFPQNFMGPTQQQQAQMLGLTQHQARLNDIRQRLIAADFNTNSFTAEDLAFLQENSGELFGF